MGQGNHFTATRVRELRREAGTSQEGLAASMREQGFPWYQTTVVRVEAGGRPVTLDEAGALAGIFGVPLGSLLTPLEAAS